MSDDYCYECGRSDPDPWWSERPRWLRPIAVVRGKIRKRTRPLRAWWYAPILEPERHERPTRCFELLRPAHRPDSPLRHIYLLDIGGQPWEHVDPNPMPAFRLWRLWPALPPQRPAPYPMKWSAFLPTFTASRGAITFRQTREVWQ